MAVVLPEYWLFLEGFGRFRQDCLATIRWRIVAELGPGAFETIGGEVVRTCLFIASAAVLPEGIVCGC